MAKAAGEGASSPALTASSSKSVEEDGQREQQGAEKVEEKKQLNKKELEVTVSAAVPIKQVQETLSVTTELGNRGEEPLYEPVSRSRSRSENSREILTILEKRDF